MAQCHLSCTSYLKNICNGFSNLQQHEEFVDMTLAAEGHLVKVHKNLIALASPYIREMLKSIPCEHPVLFLNSVSHEVLGYILEYVYCGEVHVPTESLNAFIEAARGLQIMGLKDIFPPSKVTPNILPNRKLAENIVNGSIQGSNPASNGVMQNFEQTNTHGSTANNKCGDIRITNVQSLNNNMSQQHLTSTNQTNTVTYNNHGNFEDHDYNWMNEDMAIPNTSNSVLSSKPIQEIKTETNFSIGDQLRLPISQIENKYRIEIKMPDSGKTQANDNVHKEDNFTINLVDNTVRENENMSVPDKRTPANDNVHKEDNFTINLVDNTFRENENISYRPDKQSQANDNVHKEDDFTINLIDNTFRENENISYRPDRQSQANDNVHKEDNFTINLIDNTFRENENISYRPDKQSQANDNVHKEDNFTINLIDNTVRENENIRYRPDKQTERFNIDIKLPMAQNEGTPKIIINSGKIENMPVEDSLSVNDTKAPLFTTTKRGSLQMILHRFMYNIHHKSHNSTKRRWRCIDYRHKNCRAYVDTNEETITGRRFPHTHPFHDSRILNIGRYKKVFNSIAETEADIKDQCAMLHDGQEQEMIHEDIQEQVQTQNNSG